MRTTTRFGIHLLALLALCVPTAAAEGDLRDELRPGNVASLRINLNPGGAELGFETEIAGKDPRVGALLEVIRPGVLVGQTGGASSLKAVGRISSSSANGWRWPTCCRRC